MKHVSAGIRIGILVLVATGLGHYAWKSVGEQASGADGYRLYAYLEDASGLPKKSRVVIAGLPVGEIIDRGLEGRKAKVTIRIRKGTEIWTNAILQKKSSSLLGEFYVEIDPGTSEDEHGQKRLLEDGTQIKNVAEAASTDEIMKSLSETLPHASDLLDEVRTLAHEVHELVKGPVSNIADTLDKSLTQDAELVHGILARTDQALAHVDHIVSNVEQVTGGKDEQLGRILHNIEEVSVNMRELVEVARREVDTAGSSVRAKIDRLDKSLDALDATFQNAASVSHKLNSDEGTLGKLLTDPAIANNVESITGDVKEFVKTTFGLQTIVGIRTEYNVMSEAFRTYFSLELEPRPDKFYLIEVVDDPRGKAREKFTLMDRTFARETTIDDSLRFTFQFGKIIDRYTFRIGMKESTGGGGMDVRFFDDRLTISADVFDFSFDDAPRLKVLASLQFFRLLYLYGGVDDVLNSPETLAVMDTTITGKTTQYHFGRDLFGGVMLRFNDRDLASLLFIGGSAIAGMAK